MAEEVKKQADQQDSKLKAFLKKQNIEISAKRYFIDAMGAMAQGLFASLLIGTIIGTLGDQLGLEFLSEMGGYAKSVAGPAMAVAIAYALKASPLASSGAKQALRLASTTCSPLREKTVAMASRRFSTERMPM